MSNKPTPRIVYTSERDRSNTAQHGLSLALARSFHWANAMVRRGQYETRATGLLVDGAVVVLSYRDTHDDEPVRRVNLLRNATPEESARYFERRG